MLVGLDYYIESDLNLIKDFELFPLTTERIVQGIIQETHPKEFQTGFIYKLELLEEIEILTSKVYTVENDRELC